MRVPSRRDVLSLYYFTFVATILFSTCFVQTKSDHKNVDAEFGDNYISTAELADGEKEVRMRFGDIIVKETSVSSSGTESTEGERIGLLLRQVSSGQLLLHMIYKIKAPLASPSSITSTSISTINSQQPYDSNSQNQHQHHHHYSSNKIRRKYKLLECEIINDWSRADKFRLTFKKELQDSGLNLQVPQTYWNRTSFHEEDFMEYDEMEDDEDSSRRRVQSDNVELNSNQTSSTAYQNVTARMLGNEEIADEFQESFDITLQHKLCLRLHRKQKKAMLAEKRLQKHLTSEISSHGLNSRKKREILDSFRVPGTRWCGVGSSAKEWKQLGGFAGADKCCRFHDLGCPFYIFGLSEKYGLYNWGLWTLNHCACDERFRSCLRTTNSGTANLVGKVFFNVIQNSCFVLKTEKVCTSRSWWGKCLNYELKKQAHRRDPVQY